MEPSREKSGTGVYAFAGAPSPGLDPALTTKVYC